MTPIRALCRQRGLTQLSAAQAAGISRAYMSQIARGQRVPTIRMAERLAEVLGVHVDALRDLIVQGRSHKRQGPPSARYVRLEHGMLTRVKATAREYGTTVPKLVDEALREYLAVHGRRIA